MSFGSGYAVAGSHVAAAGIYSAARLGSNALSWAKSLAAITLQAGVMYKLMDKQKQSYDKISKQQIAYLEEAVHQYVLSINNDLIPKMEEAYPDVPIAAEFVPVNPAKLTFDTLVQNLENQPKGFEMIEAMNNYHRLSYRSRLFFLSPLAIECISLEGVQIKALLQGKIPNDDVMEVFTDIADNAFATGRMGNMGRQTAAALGITKLRLQAGGREALHNHLQSLNANVSPIAGEARLEDYFQKPANMLAFALQQQELIQNSLQNLNNTRAQKPPHKLAELQAKMQMTMARLQLLANRGNLVNQYVPNFAGIFGPSFQTFMSQFQNQNDRASEFAPAEGPAGAVPPTEGSF